MPFIHARYAGETMEDSRHHLLEQCTNDDSSSFSDGPCRERCQHGKLRHSWFLRNWPSLTILFLLFYIAVLQTLDIAAVCHPRSSAVEDAAPSRHFTLPLHHLEYEERYEWSVNQGVSYPWNLGPSPELDAAWDDLLYAKGIRVSEEELHLVKENTTNRMQVDDGAYYYSMLGVMHHLHCLNNLRKVMHKDYYQTHWNEEERKFLAPFGKEHSDHCINSLREAIMCHANTAVYTGEWLDNPRPFENKALRSDSVTTCVKWESLQKWARPRALVPGTFHYKQPEWASWSVDKKEKEDG